MDELICIDSDGFEGLLEEGQSYQVQRLACGAVRVRTGEGIEFVCSGRRFAREADAPW